MRKGRQKDQGRSDDTSELFNCTDLNDEASEYE